MPPVLLKHTNNTDVAIEILESLFVVETNTYEWLVSWWNIGKCHAPFEMNLTQTIKVPLDKHREWEIYTWKYSK